MKKYYLLSTYLFHFLVTVFMLYSDAQPWMTSARYDVNCFQCTAS